MRYTIRVKETIFQNPYPTQIILIVLDQGTAVITSSISSIASFFCLLRIIVQVPPKALVTLLGLEVEEKRKTEQGPHPPEAHILVLQSPSTTMTLEVMCSCFKCVRPVKDHWQPTYAVGSKDLTPHDC